MNSAAALASSPRPALPVQQGSPSKRRVLVVEDNESNRRHLRQLLESDPVLCVDTAANGNEAIQALTERPFSLVITDLKMPHLGGMELLAEVQKRRLPVAVIVTTGYGSIDDAVKAMRLGATDFLTKPVDVDHLRLVVGRALRERAMLDELETLRQQLHDLYSFHNILSKSPRMHAVFELIGHVAQTTSTVLIEGETGTGKELVARAIHQSSPRAGGPLVAVNCAALPETLLESELFGHEKGAFTSAVNQRVGRFEMADGGTIFLDEIGEVPLAMQAKLLRVLQERRIERVGGAETIELDVRVVTATNKNLRGLAEEGKFREDLYYRLNVVKIELPPLRDRAEDIPLLVAHFCQKYSRPGAPARQVDPEAMHMLLGHSWPGNIRELENAIEHASVIARDEFIRPGDLPPDLTQRRAGKGPFAVDLSRPLPDQLAEVVAAFEKRYLRKALRRVGGHVGRAAKLMGIARRTLTGKIAEYKIDTSEFKGD
jgi:DNA-binding NtrC family response regulator